MNIPFNNLNRVIDRNRSLIDGALSRVIDRGWFILGPESNSFESAFANFLGVETCIGVANGTDALCLALLACGMTSGNKVATVANAGMYSSCAISMIGASPIFMDVDINSRNVSLAEVKKAIENGAHSVIVTHLYGLIVPEILEISKYCREKSIPLIEDCAQAHGVKMHGKFAGTFSDLGAFSFYPTKNLGAVGDGGSVVTNNQEYGVLLKSLRQYGRQKKYYVEIPGGRNSRLDEMQAAVLNDRLPHLLADNEERLKIAKEYLDKIKSAPKLLELPKLSLDHYCGHLFAITSNKRDDLKRYLIENGVATDIHYPIPDHLQPLWGRKYENVKLPNTKLLCSEILSIPCFPGMTNSEVEYVINIINSWPELCSH